MSGTRSVLLIIGLGLSSSACGEISSNVCRSDDDCGPCEVCHNGSCATDSARLNTCGDCAAQPEEICGDGVDNDCDGSKDEGCCAGVMCNDPPAVTCDGDTLQTYAAIGSCVDGACVYQEDDTECSNGCDPALGRCFDCSGECAAYGTTTCQGGQLRSCETAADGCLVWGPWTACTDGFCINASDCGICNNNCASLGVTECSNGQLRTCEADLNGCLHWSGYVDCQDGFCANSTSCGACNDACSDAGDTQCSSGTIQTCIADANGCLAWGAPIDCADGFCADAVSCGACTNTCSTAGISDCSVGKIRTCEADAYDCLAWTPFEACADGFCADPTTCGICTNTCAAAGVSDCSVDEIRVCEADVNGCLAWSGYTQCSSGFCGDATSCGSCSNQCSPAGSTACFGDGFQTCTADTNGCLDWGPVTSCESYQVCQTGACVLGPTPAAIVISELCYDSVGTDSNPDNTLFIEIFGPAAQSLDGYRLVGINGNGGTSYNELILNGHALAADSYFVIAHPSSDAALQAEADLLDAAVNFENAPDSVQLLWHSRLVDAVGYGTFGGSYVFAGEGSPAQDAGAGQSLSRDPDNTDTDDNSSDFTIQTNLTPGGPSVICTDLCPFDGDTECTGGAVRTCITNVSGCLDWSAYADCADGFCADASTCGVCTNTCTLEGATQCSAGQIRTCEADFNNCLAWSGYAACADGFCADTTTCGVCVNTCSPAGDTECSSGQLRTCFADANGCLDWSGYSDCNDDNICTDDSCNPASGCVYANNTAACEDGNACTVSDTCSGGSCQTGAARDCNDDNVCTNDSCEPVSGCVYANNTAPCEDGSACTVSDTCSDGACQGGGAKDCNDNDICTDDSCNPASGCAYANNTVSCEDGLFCTVLDSCSNGSCEGTLRDCSAFADQCLDGVCDEQADTCKSQPVADGTICDDTLFCTDPDACLAGTCSGSARDCSGLADQCNGAVCSESNDQCEAEPVANGTTCHDADNCTEADACTDGTCNGLSVGCIDGDGCCPSGCYFADTDCLNSCPPEEHPCAAGCCAWDVDLLQHGIGNVVSLALDSTDNPHVLYSNWQNGWMIYAVWTPGGWTYDLIADAGTQLVWDDLAIALDDSDRPNVAYAPRNGNVMFSRWTGTEWSWSHVDSCSSTTCGDSISLVLVDGNPRMSYRTSGAYPTYAWMNLDTGIWYDERPENSSLGWGTSLAFDSQGIPCIGYYDVTQSLPVRAELKYARRVATPFTDWDFRIVDTKTGENTEPSMVLDATDNPHFAYKNDVVDDLMYAHWTGTEWDIMAVDTLGNVGEHPSIALDPAGRPHISYWDAANDQLKYAWLNGSNWEIMVVANHAPYAGKRTRLVLDSAELPVIAYVAGGTTFVARW